MIPILVGLGSTAIAWALLQAGVSFEEFQALEIKIAEMPVWQAYGLYGLLFPVLEVLGMVGVFVALGKHGTHRYLATIFAALAFALFSLQQGWGVALIAFYSGLIFLAAYQSLRKATQASGACFGVVLVYALNNIASLIFIRT
ncbi:MAG: hypothetical protein ACOVRJ_19085 [Roseateles sp.]